MNRRREEKSKIEKTTANRLMYFDEVIACLNSFHLATKKNMIAMTLNWCRLVEIIHNFIASDFFHNFSRKFKIIQITMEKSAFYFVESKMIFSSVFFFCNINAKNSTIAQIATAQDYASVNFSAQRNNEYFKWEYDVMWLYCP